MNKWTNKSVDLAHEKGYLDKLFEIYPNCRFRWRRLVSKQYSYV